MAKEVKKKDNKKEEKVAKKGTNQNSMRSELKKVTWPTRKELINSTIAVIVIVVLTAIIVFFLDVVFESVNTYGINKLRTTVSDKVNKDDTKKQDAEEEIVTDTNTDVDKEAEEAEVTESTESTENTETVEESTTAETATTEEVN